MKKKQKGRTITQDYLGVSEEITIDVMRRRWLEWAKSFQMLVDYDNKKYDEFVQLVTKSSDEIFEKVYKQQNKEEIS
jgi:hypothetical protein|tara:strand:- start:417 stop:647 length:231 start_codon:yes stop_codon:yes gene_type:complete